MAGISSDGSVYFLDNTPDIFQITPGLLASSPGGLLGLKGNDKVSGSVEQNLIYGNQDSDILLGADKDDTLYGGKDNDLLVGKTGNDLLLGDKGNDFLLGDQGNDSLNGGNGGDTLIGNLGQDILTGGDDADVFVLQADPQVINSANADIITDFDSNIDLIRLTGGLAQSDLALEAFEGGTLIKAQLTGAILGRVLSVSVEQLSGKFISEKIDPSDPGEIGSLGQLGLFGASETAFNPLTSTVQLELFGTDLLNEPSSVTVFRNGAQLPESDIKLSGNVISLPSVLQEGSNDLEIYVTDTEGYQLYAQATLWAGNNTLTANVLDENGQPVNAGIVTAKLVDDQNITAEAKIADGKVIFQNVPSRTILLESSTGDNRSGVVGTTGVNGNVDLTLKGFNEPSTNNNNDLSLGTDGWNVGNAPVKIIPHVEDSTIESQGLSRLAQESAPSGDNDLVLDTSGEGPQSISRTFKVEPGTREVSIRYKFATSEVPGGYFGSEFNDFFNVSVRSQKAGGSTSESNSMNGLGLPVFDGNGATGWREVTLPVNPEGDVIQADIIVANVADGLYDSKVIVDQIKKNKLSISALDLNDIDNQNLLFLSAAAHSYFKGNTRINGTITIKGEKEDSLQSVKLEVLQGGKVVATGQLDATSQNKLLNQPFGDDNIVEIKSSQLLFELPSSEAAKIDSSKNGNVQLRVKAESKNGEKAQKDFGSVKILTRYTKSNRYGNGRDEVPYGGDDWVLPSVKPVIEHFAGITLGDFSNMNGGKFPPHSTHKDGTHVDGDYQGYRKFDAASARKMIEYLNDPTYGSRIIAVYVYPPNERRLVKGAVNTGSVFWKTINDATLRDGRRAIDVITEVQGHNDHFHWQIKP